MLTPGRVAFRRIIQDIRFQYGAWRMAVDWTVALYILVPAVIFGGYQYVLWWREAPSWLNAVPYLLVRNYLFVAALMGTIRLYVEEADQLFLAQRREWFGSMMAAGAAFSLAAHAGGMALIGLALYPLLRNGYGVGPVEAAGLFLITYLVKIYLMLGKQWLAMRIAGWKGFAVRLVLFPLSAALYALLAAASSRGWAAAAGTAAVLAAPLFRLIPLRLRAKGTFFHDVRRERQEKLKVAAMLLSQAGIKAPKKSKPQRKGPVLFPRSGKIFRSRSQENVLAESLMKAVLRNTSKLQLYAYALLAYTTAAVLCPSGGYRWAVWLSVSALLSWMAVSFAKEASAEPFIKLFHWQDGVRFEALWKAGAGISLPGSLWLAWLTGLLELGFLEAFLLLPVGAAVCWIGSRTFGIRGF